MASVQRLQTPLLNEMTAYETMRKEIETDYPNRWIILFDSKVVGDYDDYDEALNDAEAKGINVLHCLFRKVGASAPILIWPGD